ncbi:MAG: FGGY family carbohydrate kinase [Flavonifractor plautii]
MDTWLIWRLTGGPVHATDFTNASRTMLFNIHTLDWDDDYSSRPGYSTVLCCHKYAHPPARSVWLPPACKGCDIPIAGIAGDQQAALFGQACFAPGTARTPTAPAAFC